MTANFTMSNSAEAVDLFNSINRPFRVNKRNGQVQLKASNGLIVNSTLRKDEWEMLDMAIIQPATYALRGLNEIRSRGLIKPLGSLGTMISQWNTTSQVTPASVGMTVTNTGNRDLPDTKLNSVPVPVYWKEFQLDRRTLEASRLLGEGIDTTAAGQTARVVAEQIEKTLFGGAAVIMNGSSVYGLTNHPNRNTAAGSALGGGDWGAVANIVPTVTGAINALNSDHMYGPFTLFVSQAQYNEAAFGFFSDGTGAVQTALQRIESLPQISSVIPIDSDVLTAGTAVLVQMTPDVVDWAEAMGITLVEWTSGNGMTQYFCVMAVGTPRVKADYSGQSGIMYITGI